MGLFDFFITKEKKEEGSPTFKAQPFNYNQSTVGEQGATSKMQVYYPKSFDEVSDIIKLLAMGKPAIVNIKDLKQETSQRVLDLLSGAIYALGGGLCEIDKGLFLFSIDGIQKN
ncbi:MAG: cell division protein SepF [Christensenellaceae bacterium]